VAVALGDPDAELSGFELLVAVPPARRLQGGDAALRVSVTLLDGAVLWLTPVAVHVAPVPTAVTPSAARSTAEAGATSMRGKAKPQARGAPSQGATRVLWFARGLDLGGSQLRMAELIEHLGEVGGFTSTVLAPGDGPLRPRLEAAGATVNLTAAVSLDDSAAYERSVTDLARQMEGRFDLVVGPTVTSFPAVDAAVRLGVPSVLRIGEAEPLRTVVRWLFGDLDPGVEERSRQAIAGATVVWSNSHAAVRTYREHGSPGHFAVLAAGVDVAAARAYAGATDRDGCRERLGVRPDERLIVCVGSVWPVKGQALLVRALERVRRERPHLGCALIGQTDPLYTQAIERFVSLRGVGDAVRILPFCDDMRPWWRAADAAVCASEAESLPAVVLEAMAFALPVLGSRVGDMAELIEPGVTGWLCDPCDFGELVAGLDALAAAPGAALQRLGAAAAEKAAREFDRAVCLGRIVDVLQAAASGGRSRWSD
jgi:glycosyltransferase involved in cell wall biosynthesis